MPNRFTVLSFSVILVYTKEECDQKFSGGGGGGTTDYNQLINRPIIDGIVQSNLDMNGNSITKLYNIDASNNAFTISNPSSLKLSEWFKVENYENVRTDITTDKLLHINAPHILLNGELDNVYTKSASDARVRELFAELMNRTVQIQTLNTKNLLLYPKSTEGWSSDVFSNIYMSGSTVDDARMLIGFEDAYILLTKDTTTFDTPKSVFGIAPYNINMSQDAEADKIIFQSEQKPLEIKAPSITFTGTLENVYTKDDINNFGLGSIITAWSELDRLLISTHTEIQKLFIGMEDENNDMVFRYIQASNAYPEIGRVKNDIKELQVSEYKLNATRGITTNELQADNVYTKSEVDAKIAESGGGSIGNTLALGGADERSVVVTEYDGFLSVGGLGPSINVTEGSTIGALTVGGQYNSISVASSN